LVSPPIRRLLFQQTSVFFHGQFYHHSSLKYCLANDEEQDHFLSSRDSMFPSFQLLRRPFRDE